MQTGMVQNLSGNIEKELDTKCIIIFGRPRNGKTILAATIGYQNYRKRIYSNFNIYYKGISINNRFNSFKEISNIQYSATHGVILFDEAGINANSKDFMTDTNRSLSNVLFLSGKKNCDMIMIAQSYESVGADFKRNAIAFFEVVKIKRYGRKPIFMVYKVVPNAGSTKRVDSWQLDTLALMSILKITYDTLDESKMIEVTNKKQIKESEKEKKILKLNKKE